jgi:hypothetical protein
MPHTFAACVGFDETIIMLMDSLEKLQVTVQETTIKRPPPPPPGTTPAAHGAPKKKEPVKAKAKAKPKSRRNADLDDDDDDDEVVAPKKAVPLEDDGFFDHSLDKKLKEEIVKPLDPDAEGVDIHDPLNGKSEVYYGLKALIKREFLVTPKTSMITKPKMVKQKRVITFDRIKEEKRLQRIANGEKDYDKMDPNDSDFYDTVSGSDDDDDDDSEDDQGFFRRR